MLNRVSKPSKCQLTQNRGHSLFISELHLKQSKKNFKQKEFKSAIAYCNNSIELKNSEAKEYLPELYLKIAMEQEKGGNLEEAIEYYKKAIKHENSEAKKCLSQLYLRQAVIYSGEYYRNFDNAIYFCKKAVVLGNAEAEKYLPQLYIAQKKYQEAKKKLDEMEARWNNYRKNFFNFI